MKYTTEVTIELSRQSVIELFDNVDNMYKWQEGLKSCEHIEGEPGEVGSRSMLVYEGRRGDLKMTETITKRNFPDEYHADYKARGVHNQVNNYFTEAGAEQTTWRMVNIFRFNGLMALMAPFMKTAFSSNTLLNMERFKSFAEQSKNL
ncbi:MAG: SRPBCC family protein [Bacteroidota bacterium]